MAYRLEKSKGDGQAIVIDGWEKGIAASPYAGIGNIRNLNTNYYPGVAYVNYRRRPAAVAGNAWFAGTHSVNVSNNLGWSFTAGPTTSMTNPLHKAISPAGIIYILDDTGQIWKQDGVNVDSFSQLGNGGGRQGDGHGGLAYWNNYLVVFGDDMIEFCGDGSGDAAITSANWNIPGTPYHVDVTSTILAAEEIPPVGYEWTGTVAMGATTATLTSVWTGVSGVYFVRFSNSGPDTKNATFTNGSATVTWTGGLGSAATVQFFMYQMTATPLTLVGIDQFTTGSPVTFSSTGSLPTGISPATTYYLNSGVDLTGATPFTFSASLGAPFIQLTDAGSGTITMSVPASTSPPIVNTSDTVTIVAGATTFELTSPWLQASGQYNIVDPFGNNLLGVFTYLSPFVTLLAPAIIGFTGMILIQILDPDAPTYKTWVSKVDGNLYFANGRNVGRILSENTNIIFNPGVPVSYIVNYSVVALLQPSDTVVDMTDLKSSLVIAGNFDTYTWDYISPTVSAPSPVGEQIYRITNLLSNIYILAGTKGNLYVSNGYSNQVLTKLSDFISESIDPIWNYGDIMVHRSRLWFQATIQTTAGVNVLSGIFSIIVSPSVIGEVASGLTMEAQNSYGLTPVPGTAFTGCLIDYESFSTGVDKYYSAWSGGPSMGGIDYNDTSLWQNNEPLIETDIIPIGTFLEMQTMGNIEFKLDRPMAVGDSISLYWRPSLNDAYTLIKTTTDPVLADYKQSDIAESQWAQFLVTMSCAATGSSFIPLREIRIHYS